MTKRRFITLLLSFNVIIIFTISIVVISVWSYMNTHQASKDAYNSTSGTKTDVGPLVLGLATQDNNKFFLTMQQGATIRLLQYDANGNSSELFHFSSSSLLPVNTQIVQGSDGNFYYLDTNFTNYVVSKYNLTGTRSVIYTSANKIAAISYHAGSIYILTIESDNQVTPTFQIVQIDNQNNSNIIGKFDSSYSYYIAEINDNKISLKDLEYTQCQNYDFSTKAISSNDCNLQLVPPITANYVVASRLTTGQPISYPVSYPSSYPQSYMPADYQDYIYASDEYNSYQLQYSNFIKTNPAAANNLVPPTVIYQSALDQDLNLLYSDQNRIIALDSDHNTNARKLITINLKQPNLNAQAIDLPLVSNVVFWGYSTTLNQLYFDFVSGSNGQQVHNLYVYSWDTNTFGQFTLPLCSLSGGACNYGFINQHS